MDSNMQNIKSRLTGWLVRGVLILNAGLAISYIGLWLIAARQDLLWRADFSAFYTGWAIVRDGHGSQLYDFDLQSRYQQSILENRSFSDGLLPFTYPPHVAFFFAPISQLPRSSAFGLWTLLECMLLVWLLNLLKDYTRSWQPTERWLTFSGILGFPPLFYNFMLGAFSLFLLICLWLFYLNLKNDRDQRSGIWLVIGSIKPQNILLPGILLLGAKRWRAVAGAISLGVVILVVTSLGLGWRVWLDFLSMLRSLNSMYGTLGMEPTSMYNFKGMLTSLVGTAHGSLINQISWVALFATILLTWRLWQGARDMPESRFDLRIAFTLMLGLLFNPYLFPQDALLLVLPVILFYNYLRLRDLPRRAYSVFVLLCPICFLASEFAIGNRLGIRLPTVVMIILTLWMGGALLNERNIPKPLE
jgi:hypothetical protein